jgi:hypothetical protein
MAGMITPSADPLRHCYTLAFAPMGLNNRANYRIQDFSERRHLEDNAQPGAERYAGRDLQCQSDSLAS